MSMSLYYLGMVYLALWARAHIMGDPTSETGNSGTFVVDVVSILRTQSLIK